MTRKLHITALLMIGCVVLVGCRTAQTSRELIYSPEEDQAQIDKLREQWISASTSQDPADTVRLLAPDGAILPRDGEIVQGERAVQAFAKAAIEESSVSKVEVKPEKTVIRGDIAVEFGSCSGFVTPLEQGEQIGDPVPAENNYMLFYERQRDGTWKIKRAISVDTQPVKNPDK